MEDFRVYSCDVLVGWCCGLSVWHSLYVRDDVVGFHGGRFLIFTRLLSRCYFLIWDNIRYTRFCLSGSGCFFFSRSEEMEHTTLLSQIDQLGVQPEKKADEG